MAQESKKTSTLEFLATFILLFLVVNYGLKFLFPNQFADQAKVGPQVDFAAQSAKVRAGNNPELVIGNRTEKDLPLPSRCPQPPVDIAIVKIGAAGEKEKTDLMANTTAVPCETPAIVRVGETLKLDLGPWKYSLFSENATYEASLELPTGFIDETEQEPTVLTAQFTVVEPGFATKLFRTFISQPLFNGLIFIASFLPDHNLGLAIILLTLVVRLILLIPNQHALEGQHKMQMVQPRMEEIKKKYSSDPKRVQEETMKLWKELKINPLQSCLPMLLQFPVLIGLFFVIRDGTAIATSQHLLYSVYSDLPAQFFGTHFLGFDLLKPSHYVLPPLLVVMQFVQMKMMFVTTKKATPIDGGKKSWMPTLDQQTIMLYVLPLMIGFFAIGFPAAVSIYWGASTLFGIAQQWYVLRKK